MPDTCIRPGGAPPRRQRLRTPSDRPACWPPGAF